MDERDAARTGGDEWLVGFLFIIGIAGALAAAVVYALDGQTQLEGISFAVAFAGLGGGLVVWAHRLLGDEEVEQPWDFAPEHRTHEAELTAELHEELDHGEVLDRRPFLRRLLLGGFAALGVAAVFPIRSLGPEPGNALRVTPWRRGRRLVDADGRPIRADAIPVGGLVTVYPAGHLDAADAVAVAVRVGARETAGSAAPATGAVDATASADARTAGVYVYSKVCTHAGCPVGLYVDSRRTLLCPCHQSEFDVTDRGKPLTGPADRALPRLPIRVDADGTLVADGDFDAPSGPGWWTL